MKVQFGKSKIPFKLLVHDQASMKLNCPGLHNVAQTLKSQGHQLADRFITSDALTGIEILIGVDYFSCFVSRLKRAQSMNLFVTKGGVIPYGPLPKWSSFQQTHNQQYNCAGILCEGNPNVSELWELDRIGINKEEFSPLERKTVTAVKANLQKTNMGYIVRIPFKDDTRPSVNYRTVCGELNTLAQQASCVIFYTRYEEVIRDYLNLEFIEKIPDDHIDGHYLPHHPVFKKSATTSLRIVFNSSSKPARGKSLNDCLLTGPTLIANLHDILLSFRKGSSLVLRTYRKPFITLSSVNKIEIILNSCGSTKNKRTYQLTDSM